METLILSGLDLVPLVRSRVPCFPEGKDSNLRVLQDDLRGKFVTVEGFWRTLGSLVYPYVAADTRGVCPPPALVSSFISRSLLSLFCGFSLSIRDLYTSLFS